jgi:GNAT superfamily N-acetyltransferase
MGLTARSGDAGGRCDDGAVRFDGRVRPATACDAADVARIYTVSWNEGFGHLLGVREPSPGDGDRWKGELTSGRARWWVAQTGRRVAGFAGVCPSRDPVERGLGELDTIAVDPRDWRTGVGRALMTVALDALRRAGCAEAIVWTPAGYQRGHAFYRATGWLPDGGRRDGGRQVSFRQPLTTTSSPRT